MFPHSGDTQRLLAVSPRGLNGFVYWAGKLETTSQILFDKVGFLFKNFSPKTFDSHLAPWILDIKTYRGRWVILWSYIKDNLDIWSMF